MKILTNEFGKFNVIDMEEYSDFDLISVEKEKIRLKNHSMIKAVIPNKLLYVTQSGFNANTINKKMVNVVKMLNASYLWSLGYTGKGIRVAVIDTGLNKNQKFVKYLKSLKNFSNETNVYDENGHGTFIASVISSSDSKCLGLAPDVDLHVLRTFNKNLSSYTAWFLKAFNFVLMKRIHIVNLSLGGIDFTDDVFVHKIQELISNNIVIVAAAGNEGPFFGTINNPADQIEVIGVGGIGQLSSRGMTTWELPEGVGRMKPDLLTYGENVIGLGLKENLMTLDGSSVATAVTTGAIALLLSYKKRKMNVAFIKQAITLTADRHANVYDEFQQGFGQLNLIKAFEWITKEQHQITLSPRLIDFTDCPFQWIKCVQPIYLGAMPFVSNITVVNSIEKLSKLQQIFWQPDNESFCSYLQVACEFNSYFWPWHGTISVMIAATKNWSGIVKGKLKLLFTTGSSAFLPIIVKVIESPPRSKRLLWDQYHNLHYPKNCVLTDDLETSNKRSFDWTGDHIYTNFRKLFNHLRTNSFYVEILSTDFTCFNASNYGALILMDPERKFTKNEIVKIRNDVNILNMSLIIFADWFNYNISKKKHFFQRAIFNNCESETISGSNIGSLNDLLNSWSIELSHSIYSGDILVGSKIIKYRSGSSIIKLPDECLFYSAKLKNIVSDYEENVRILGLHPNNENGKIAVFGDSNCLDEYYNEKMNCFWILDILLQNIFSGHVSNIFHSNNVIFKKADNITIHESVAFDAEKSCKQTKWLKCDRFTTGERFVQAQSEKEKSADYFNAYSNEKTPSLFFFVIMLVSFLILYFFKKLLQKIKR